MECLTFGLKLLELLYINHDNTILHMIGKGLGGGGLVYIMILISFISSK